jgi:hypothetical protein
MPGVRKDRKLCAAEVCACAGRREVECTVKNVPPSNTDGAHRVEPRGLLRKTGGSQSTFSSIERPVQSFAAYTQLAMQTLALCAFGVRPKMRPCVFGCRQPRAERYNTLVSAGGRLRRGRADSAEGVGALSGKGAHSTCDGNPLVDVRTGAGHADVRLGGLWNRHVWKKDTRARAGRFIKYQNR